MYLGKRKNGIFFIEYFDEERDLKRRVSTRSKNKKEALKFLVEFEKKLEGMNQEKIITLASFKSYYINYIGSTHSKKYLESIDLSFRKLQNFLEHDFALNKISVQQLQHFMSISFSKTKYGTIMYIRTLKAAFTRAVEWGYISENPFKKIKLPRTPKNFPVFINDLVFSKIIECTNDVTMKDIFNCAFFTGMRLGEIVNLKWDAVNLDTKIIFVRNDDDFVTKSKRERLIPINEKLYVILLNKFLNRSKNSNHVFTKSNGFKYNNNHVSKYFKKVVRSLNLNPKIHFHTLRHSFASNLVQKDVSLYVVKELLGHEDISTTQIYSHLRKENLFEAVQLL